VSCSLPTRLTAAARLIEAAQQASVPVLAGGRGFGPEARWARRLGADRGAATVTDALRELESWPPPMAVPVAGPHDWYAVDDEHELVAKRRGELVDRAMSVLAGRFDAVRRYTPAQRDATIYDLEQIVDFLVAGLFVDDPELFGGFVEWLGVVLGSRHVPVATVETVLETFESALYDFPRALDHLAVGRSRICTS
jgi:hypothetical protein